MNNRHEVIDMLRVRVSTLFSLALLPLCQVAQADSTVVVPGKIAGYLYTGSEGGASAGEVAYEDDKRISLAVFKLGEFTDYQIISEPVGLMCDKLCTERADKVPSGHITLRIVGNIPVPGVDIPLKGKWQAPCENTTTATDVCDMKLTELNAQVRVTVSGELAVGTEVPLPEGGTALFMQLNGSYMLVADHNNISSNLSWLTHDPERKAKLSLSSQDDGPGNTQTLANAGSEAAQYCLSRGNGWYLPARSELNLITADVSQAIPGWQGAWSSTEKEFEYKFKSQDEESWKYKAYYYGSKGDDTTAYEYKLKWDKKALSWSVNTDSTSRSYQALCFRRLPL